MHGITTARALSSGFTHEAVALNPHRRGAVATQDSDLPQRSESTPRSRRARQLVRCR
jgi:hypothetical protein